MSKVRDARGAELSESAVLDNVEALLEDAARLPVSGSWAREVREVLSQVHRLQGQVARRLHTNPGALVMYGNPGRSVEVGPGSEVAVKLGPNLGFIEQLKYKRTTRPQGYYFHDFGAHDALYVVTVMSQRAVLIVNVDGKPLWGKS